MNSSILSFPQRGAWGQSSYRGNCSGHVQKFLIEKFKPSYFVDPADGGGTSRDVCQQLGIKYTGLDLKDGFNLLKHNLKEKLQGQPDFIFFHPPYGSMVAYSGCMWGNPHPDDLSRCGNGEDSWKSQNQSKNSKLQFIYPTKMNNFSMNYSSNG